MKPSAVFIMSFIATVFGFSPYAVAKHTNFPKYAESGKHCEFDGPDHVVVRAKFNKAIQGAPRTAHSANYVGAVTRGKQTNF